MKNNDIVIAICDDENNVLESLELFLSQCRMSRCDGNNIKIERYDTSAALLANISQVDILFVDIEMPEPDGFEVAEQIRTCGLDIKIIFVTSHREYIQRAFKVRAFRYLYKPFQREEIVEVFNEAMDDLMKTETVCSGTDYIRVREIYYVEALGDGTAIHEKDNITISSKSLKYWEEKLGEDFYRCHKTYLISFFHVLSLNNYRVVLSDRIELPVAVRRWHPMKESYDEYIRKNARII